MRRNQRLSPSSAGAVSAQILKRNAERLKGSGPMTITLQRTSSSSPDAASTTPHGGARSCRPPRMPRVSNRARRMTWRLGLRLPPTPKPPGHSRQPVPPHTRLR
ncbi:uncharacterized protein SCHCODRAFT_02619757 [Schizophyllum commune H4-8]|uniref:uncharacterized protein n=1 Tax=Schizophyllum commune (strain H4-8 / FGSC 9210) TaxID=578458 RepID=UPI00215E4713|nr:uncharacterized protein SCHCODRAFT_02619757 [Schizophyllum commune H4-8]KAI5895558.1 hypothetical protein SCHCODRAFT_02619757 [Schizophyllum commune H4-8]